MKLYTRSGDDGTTGLFGGERVAKDHIRVSAYGTIDELNASLGIVVAGLTSDQPVERRMREILTVLQSRLFDIGADLATPSGSRHESKIQRIEPHCISEMESWIDEIESGNEPMQTFVLPGGTEAAARLHLARTICRRAERTMVTLGKTEEIGDAAIIYINRLSDLLFAMARRINREHGVADVPWQKRT